MNETTIRLPDETVNYLQRLDYEIAGLQVLHTHALKAGTPLEQRMEIKREFQEIFAEYQMAKNEMWAEFAPRFPNMKRWWVDFQTGELHVEVAPLASPLMGEVARSAGGGEVTAAEPSCPPSAPFGGTSPTRGEARTEVTYLA